MDIISKERRSWNMGRIRSKDTKPEIIVRSLLHRAGYRFRLHCRNLPGTPDIVLPKYKSIIFVHGCYWHRHEDCKYAYIPKSREDFWEKKFKANVERHKKVSHQLQELGWRQLVVWECETKNLERLIDKLSEFLESV